MSWSILQVVMETRRRYCSVVTEMWESVYVIFRARHVHMATENYYKNYYSCYVRFLAGRPDVVSCALRKISIDEVNLQRMVRMLMELYIIGKMYQMSVFIRIKTQTIKKKFHCIVILRSMGIDQINGLFSHPKYQTNWHGSFWLLLQLAITRRIDRGVEGATGKYIQGKRFEIINKPLFPTTGIYDYCDTTAVMDGPTTPGSTPRQQ